MEKKLAISKRVFVEDISPFIRIDMHTEDEAFPVSNLTERLLDGGLSETERFHFGSEELYPAFYIFFHKKVMICLLVVGYKLYTFSHSSSSSSAASAGIKSIVLLSVSTE